MIQMHNVYKTLFTLTIALSAANPCLALDSDREKKIYIESQSATLSQNDRRAEFTGQVKIDQGSTHITSDTFTLFFSENNEMQRALATSTTTLAHFQTLPKEDQEVLHAKAKRIEYDVASETITLLGNAKAWQGDNVVEGEHLIVERASGRIQAKATPTKRTTIVINPASTSPTIARGQS